MHMMHSYNKSLHIFLCLLAPRLALAGLAYLASIFAIMASNPPSAALARDLQRAQVRAAPEHGVRAYTSSRIRIAGSRPTETASAAARMDSSDT